VRGNPNAADDFANHSHDADDVSSATVSDQDMADVGTVLLTEEVKVEQVRGERRLDIG
jgi:hypothetical protein